MCRFEGFGSKEKKMIRTSIVVLAISLLPATALIAQERTIPTGAKKETAIAWFDMENCPICKCMAAEKGLMESIKWETHLIDNGMISITTVPSDKKEAMAKCEKEMKAAIDKVKAGEKMPLCGFCTSYAALIEAGAKEQEIKTETGTVSLMTSDKPEVVKKIQDHAKKTISEYTALQTPKKTTTK